jgi:hypothetical protein
MFHQFSGGIWRRPLMQPPPKIRASAASNPISKKFSFELQTSKNGDVKRRLATPTFVHPIKCDSLAESRGLILVKTIFLGIPFLHSPAQYCWGPLPDTGEQVVSFLFPTPLMIQYMNGHGLVKKKKIPKATRVPLLFTVFLRRVPASDSFPRVD